MVDIAKIEKIMELMSKHDIDVVQAESEGEKLSLSRKAAHAHLLHMPPPPAAAAVPMVAAQPQAAPATHEVVSAVPQAPAAAKQPEGDVITSPFVGTFYRAPNPETAPFVELGSKVRKGQALCIVEAMKLMNEIECEVDGEIVAILVENAKTVEFGTPLFVIKPLK